MKTIHLCNIIDFHLFLYFTSGIIYGYASVVTLRRSQRSQPFLNSLTENGISSLLSIIVDRNER